MLGDASEVQNSKKHQNIYNCLKQQVNGALTARQVSAITGYPIDFVRTVLKRMVDKESVYQPERGKFSIKK